MDNRTRKLLLAGGGAVILLVLLALYLLGGRPQDGLLARLQDGLGSVTGASAPRPAAGDGAFAFRRLEIDTGKPQAEACLYFSRRLDGSGRTHYEDYIRIEPAIRFAARVVEDRLCLAGLAFDKTYNVTLKAGFPATGETKLAEEESISVQLRDKPALVRFAGGIVLPRNSMAGVPVTTVNVERLDIKIIRVGDRLLSQIETGALDQTQLYGWDQRQLEQNQGVLLFQGGMKVENIKNGTVVTQIPIHNLLKGRRPGAYVLLAADAARKKSDNPDGYDYSQQMAAQWVVDSDIALTSFQSAGATGGAGLTLFARSYDSTRPLSGVRLALIARNNNELAQATTDSNGRADFDAGLLRATGGDEPVMVMAYGPDGDFSFLDLRRSAFDLTDRGVGGRESPGPIDTFLYTDRGIYRPGETVHAAALLRDRVAAAMQAPLTLVATRPDGMEVGRTVIAGGKLQAGGAAWDLGLSKSAPHGRWQIAAFVDPKAPAIGRVQFDVADFVPQRLNVTLTAREQSLRPGGDFHIRAEARFLYGAPGGDLGGDGEAVISADTEPYPDYRQYRFGRMDDSYSETRVDLSVPDTDAAGVTNIAGNTGALADTTLPLKATLRVSIHEPGGRATEKSVIIPIRTHDIAIGLRPDFEGAAIPENSRAGFQVIVLDADGKRIARPGLTYSWVREDTTYQWFQSNGEWRYQPSTRDRLVTSGRLDAGGGAPARLAETLPWGTFRLTVSDAASGAASSFRFYSGWSASASGDRPDRMPVAADKPAYTPGSVARIRIRPDADGKALVVVAGDKVFSSRLIDAPASGATVDIPVSADWGAGAYVLVTHYRAMRGLSEREPVRAIGLTWVGVDNGPRTLGVKIGAADTVRPRQTIHVPVTLTGLSGRESAHVTLAAVDEGILQLTDFQSPDPVTWYFGKRRLGVLMRDDYGRLIRAGKAALGVLQQGGDGFGGRGLAVVPQKTVALFSGIVTVGKGGVASIPLAVPDFNGSLRLMAVAWSDDKLGRADKALTVRDSVVADLILPRFLAPGDSVAAALTLDNVEGPAGAYAATIRTSGPLSMPAGAQTVLNQTLNRAERALLPVSLTGAGIGVATITLDVTGPNGFRVSHDWRIEVRPAQRDIAREDEVPFAAGAGFTANRALIADLVPSTAAVSLSVSASHGFGNVAGLLKWLDKYPYGCLEQTASRAMPLLLFNDMADLAGYPREADLRQRVQDAVDHVLDMQNYAGNFGLWGPGSDAEDFLSVYALDFVTRAKAKGYVVPNDAIRRGTNWLKGAASGDGRDLPRAYAFYVLAQNGQANISDLRYFSDTKVGGMTSALAAALTGAAAAQLGDRARAVYGFDKARDIVAKASESSYARANAGRDFSYEYDSLLRDLSGVIALAADSGQADRIPFLMERSRSLSRRIQDTSTQEKGWMLRAAYALSRQRVPLNVTVDGAPAPVQGNAVRLVPAVAQLDSGITLANRGDAAVWRSVAVSGTPAAALPAMASGATITKSIWTTSGSPVDLSSLHQNDRVIVEISGTVPDGAYRQMGVIDLLPAGLEIEQALKPDSGKAYKFLAPLTAADMQDARDDRFVAAFTLYTGNRRVNREDVDTSRSFHIAYVARAVSVGRFALPAATVEDMYAPGVRARTAMGLVTIAK